MVAPLDAPPKSSHRVTRPTVMTFCCAQRRRYRIRYYAPVTYHLGDGTTGTLRRAVWIHIGAIEIRVTL